MIRYEFLISNLLYRFVFIEIGGKHFAGNKQQYRFPNLCRICIMIHIFADCGLQLHYAMHNGAVKRRVSRQLQRAVAACMKERSEGGISIRKASIRFHIAKSTISDEVLRRRGERPPRLPQGRKPAFSVAEEKVILGMLLKYADLGAPMTRMHLREAIGAFTETLPEERRIQLPFKNGAPGYWYLRAFEKRHRKELRFNRPTKQESRRWAAVNAESIATHFVTLRNIVDKFNLDPARIWNLDETGSSPGRVDVGVNAAVRRYTRRNGTTDLRFPDFVSESRITMLAAVSADGDAAAPMFVFHGSTIPYQKILVDGKVVHDTYSMHLPRNSMVTMRKEGGGVDSSNFLAWAKQFVHSVKDLTAGGRRLLLTYDGYRSHMSLAVLELYAANGIIVYALPSHTSGKTQPMDVLVFGLYKSAFKKVITNTVDPLNSHKVTMYAFCDFMRTAYVEAFTRQNIQAAFRRCGMWPIDPSKLCPHSRPRDINDQTTLVSATELVQLYEKKREEARRNVHGNESIVLERGFVSTTRGAVLTAEGAMNAMRKRALEDEKRRRAEEVTAARKALATARRIEKERATRVRQEELRMSRVAQLAKITPTPFKKQYRSLAVRRSAARCRVSQLRAKQHTTSSSHSSVLHSNTTTTHVSLMTSIPHFPTTPTVAHSTPANSTAHQLSETLIAQTSPNNNAARSSFTTSAAHSLSTINAAYSLPSTSVAHSSLATNASLSPLTTITSRKSPTPTAEHSSLIQFTFCKCGYSSSSCENSCFNS